MTIQGGSEAHQRGVVEVALDVGVATADGVVCCRCAAWQRWRAAAGPPPRPPSPAVSAGAVAVLALGTLHSCT